MRRIVGNCGNFTTSPSRSFEMRLWRNLRCLPEYQVGPVASPCRMSYLALEGGTLLSRRSLSLRRSLPMWVKRNVFRMFVSANFLYRPFLSEGRSRTKQASVGSAGWGVWLSCSKQVTENANSTSIPISPMAESVLAYILTTDYSLAP